MGTSKGFPLPTGGNWTDLKREATRYVQSGPDKFDSDARSLLGKFIHAHGGAKTWTSGGGGVGGGGGSIGGTAAVGHAARSTGRSLGGFLSGVSSGGLP